MSQTPEWAAPGSVPRAEAPASEPPADQVPAAVEGAQGGPVPGAPPAAGTDQPSRPVTAMPDGQPPVDQPSGTELGAAWSGPASDAPGTRPVAASTARQGSPVATEQPGNPLFADPEPGRPNQQPVTHQPGEMGQPFAAQPPGQPLAAHQPGWQQRTATWGPPQNLSRTGLPLADPGDRLLARLIDMLVLMVPSILAAIVIYGAAIGLGLALLGQPDDEGRALAWFGLLLAALTLQLVASAIVSYVYDVGYLRRHGGQTIGKRARKLRVVSLDGSPVTANQSRKRWLAYEGASLVSAIPFVGSIVSIYIYLDVLWLLWDKPDRQCLHDKYAKTLVVRVPTEEQATA